MLSTPTKLAIRLRFILRLESAPVLRQAAIQDQDIQRPTERTDLLGVLLDNHSFSSNR